MTLRARPPVAADAAAVAAIGNAFEQAMAGDEADEWTETEVLREWNDLGDLSRDAWLVERDGVAAGFATVLDPEPDESVSPAPRSHTRMRMSCPPSGR